MIKTIIGKHINGITLNPLEYLLEDDGQYKTFDSEEDAKGFLRDQGLDDEDMEFMWFKKYDTETDEVIYDHRN